MSDEAMVVSHVGEVELSATPARRRPSFDEVVRLSKALAQARGFVPRHYVGQPAAIAACILMGDEMDIPPMRSLRQIHVVDGRPEASAELMLDRMIAAGVRHQWLHTDAERARLRLTRPGFEAYEHEYTLADARLAGLAGKDNWKKHPAEMLRARCVSGAKRAYCPDVMGGVYSPGEVGGAEVVEDGEVVPEASTREAETPSPVAAPPSAAPASPKVDIESRPLVAQALWCKGRKAGVAQDIIAAQETLRWDDARVLTTLGAAGFASATPEQMQTCRDALVEMVEIAAEHQRGSAAAES